MKKLGILFLLLGMSILSGCFTTTSEEIKKMEAHQNAVSIVPNKIESGLTESPFSVGDVFAYNNPPERMEVVRVDPKTETVFWRYASGKYKQTNYSTILPSLKWGSSVNTSKQSGRRTITELSNSIHPLEKGKSFTFKANLIHDRPPISYKSEWKCTVNDEKEIKIKAGTFNTWEVICKVNGIEKMLVNYSDMLKTVVRVVKVTDQGQTVSRELVGFAENKKN